MAIQLTFIRLLAILVVCGFFLIGGRDVAHNFYAPFLNAHYVMALIFLVNLKKAKAKGRRYITSLGVLFVLSAIITNYQAIQIFIYFGIHSVLTDIYMPRYLGEEQSTGKILSRVPFNAITYFFFIRNIPYVKSTIGSEQHFLLVIISFVLMLTYNLWRKNKLPWYELPFLLAAIVSFHYDFVFEAFSIIFYHIILWLFLPMLKMKWRSIKLVSLHFVLFGLFVVFPLGDTLFVNPKYCWSGYCVGLIGYFHITMSFGTSILNPIGLQRFFGFSK